MTAPGLAHPTGPRLIAAAPVLFVRDVAAAALHYRDAMGFTFSRFWGEPAAFVILRRDALQFMLKQVDDPACVVPHATVSPGLWDMYLYVDGVDALYGEFLGRGATIGYPPCDQEYGCRDFATLDLDGHSVAFGQDITPVPDAPANRAAGSAPACRA